MMHYLRCVSVLAVCAMFASCSPAAPPPAAEPAAEQEQTASAAPANVGDCVDTTVTRVGPRLEGVPTSGSGIEYANGMSQVSYDALPGIDHSTAGDAVRLCLVSVPETCPPGDNRGRVYAGTNLRT